MERPKRKERERERAEKEKMLKEPWTLPTFYISILFTKHENPWWEISIFNCSSRDSPQTKKQNKKKKHGKINGAQ